MQFAIYHWLKQGNLATAAIEEKPPVSINSSQFKKLLCLINFRSQLRVIV